MRHVTLGSSMHVWIAALAILILSTSSAYAIPAFPGAEGYGAESTGGRGGDVYHVTSLADDFTPGTLRYGIYANPTYSNRTIVFDVSGAIQLQSTLYIYGENITIAGQTAPGEGICLENADVEVYGNNLTIRHIRCRMGNGTNDVDAMGLLYGNNIIIDHCSASWSQDEVLSATKQTTNATIQYCTIAEGLNIDNHSYGSLFRPDVDCNLSVHDCLYADNRSRNPRAGTYNNKLLTLDFRNNVMYNWTDNCGYSGIPGEYVNMNYVGNYCIAGPSTTSGNQFAFDSVSSDTAIYQSGNKIDGDRNGVLDGTASGWGMFTGSYTPKGASFSVPPVYTQTADAALATVLSQAGAFPWNRDPVDANVIAQVRTYGTSGSFYNSVADAGGWPTYPVATRDANYYGSGGGGIAASWAIAHGLDPNVNNDNGDFDNDGYTNLEEYLNSLAPIPAPTTIVWSGGTGRYELITNWAIPWQPTLADCTEIDSGKATVGYIGQEAGTLYVANAAGSDAELAITGGRLTVGTDLILGGVADARGTLTVSGGSLSALAQYVGASGTGVANQSGGTNTGDYLILGADSGASGTYTLSGGSLRMDGDQYVGFNGTGNFIQSGGTSTGTQSLHLGYNTGACGTYDLVNGSLSTWTQWVGTDGTGVFRQSGGTNTVATELTLGADSNAYGMYDLSGGSLRAKTQYIGYVGTGNFSQSGGTNIVTDLFLGQYAGADGTYDLAGGSLGTLWSQNVGYTGRGTFNQSGGTNLVRFALYVGEYAGSDGTFNLSGGLLTSGGSTILGYDGNAHGVMNITGGSLAATGPMILALGTSSTAELYVAKAATIQAGNLTINSGSGRSTKVSMELDSNGHSLIGASGTVSLAGALNVQGLNGYRPNQGDTFALITSTSMSGTFASITSNIAGQLLLDPNNPAGGYWSIFRGAAVGTNYVVTFQGAMAGDATGDNKVDSGDFGAIARNWEQSGKTWYDGDFNGDGVVDNTDFGAVARNWGSTGLAPSAAPLDAPIPEPATLVMLALSGLSLIRRRRS